MNSKLKVTTTSNVNVRSKPGIIYNIASSLNAGTTVDVLETTKDSLGNVWYKINDGYIAAKYTTQDVNKRQANSHTIMRASSRRAIGDSISDAAGSAMDSASEIANDVFGGNVSGAGAGIGDAANSIMGGSSDLFLARRMWNVPYQFMASTDARLKSGTMDDSLGMAFYQLMSEAPILSVIPGKPLFMPDLSNSEKDGFIQQICDGLKGLQEAKIVGKLINGEVSNMTGLDTKFFSFAPDFGTHVGYWNTLCQMFASFMGIGEKTVPGLLSSGDSGNTRLYQNFNWAYYTLANLMAARDTNVEQYVDASVNQTPVSNGDGPGTGMNLDGVLNIFSLEKFYTDFIISPQIGYSETFNNQTKESQVAGMFQSGSDLMKEFQFLFDAGAIDVSSLNENKAQVVQGMKNANDKLGGSYKAFFGRLINGATAILSGANLVFPEIWSNSNFSRSYNINMKLTTPYGNRESIFLDIIVPMLFWVALAAPRQNTPNAFVSPPLVRCHVPGLFSIDMGMIDNLTINKGGDGSAWSVDGFPLEVDLSISIRDLYSSLMVSSLQSVSPRDAYNFALNTALIDYISVQTGLNMKQSEYQKKLELIKAFAGNTSYRFTTGMGMTVKENLGDAIKQFMASGARGIMNSIFGG